MSSSIRPTRAGFTLLEMIVVLVVLSLVFILVGVGRSPLSPTTEARSSVRAMSEALRVARSEAIAENRSVSFVLDLTNRTYRLDQQETYHLSQDLQVALLTSSRLTAANSIGEIRFDPDGGSSGGRISVAAGRSIWWIGVDWISGRITAAKKAG